MRKHRWAVGMFLGLFWAAGNAARADTASEPEIKITRNYSEEYNAKIRALPESDLAKFELGKAWKARTAWTGDRESTPGRRRAKPGTPEWDALVKWVEANEKSLGHLRVAGGKKASGWLLQDTREPTLREALGDDGITPDPSLPLAMISLSYLGEVRTSGWLLAADAQLAIDRRDASRWEADVQAIVGLGLQGCAEPTLIQKLVGHSLLSYAFRSVRHAIEAKADFIDDAAWKRTDGLLSRIASDPRTTATDEGEQWMTADLIQRAYTDDGRGDGRITSEGWGVLWNLIRQSEGGFGADKDEAFRVIAASLASRKEEVDLLARRNAFLPAWAASRIGAIDGGPYRGWERDVSRVDRRHLVASLFAPDLVAAYRVAEQTKQDASGLRLAVAAERFRRKSGAAPLTVADLVPSLLEEAPLDRWTGKPVIMTVRDGSLRVYSAGADGDDDGGTPMAGGNGFVPKADWWAAPAKDRPSGDYVIFPEIEP